MDTDLSNYVDLNEIWRFIKIKKLIHKIPYEIAEAMFWDAAKCRKIITEKSYSKPLSDIEILAATRINYMKDGTGKIVPFPRKYREEWLMILKSI